MYLMNSLKPLQDTPASTVSTHQDIKDTKDKEDGETFHQNAEDNSGGVNVGIYNCIVKVISKSA